MRKNSNLMSDSDLFKQLVKGVKPLEQDKIAYKKRQPSSVADPNSVDLKPSSDPDFPFQDLDLETGPELSYAEPGLQKAVLRKLKQGKYPVQSELDLHGLYAKQAERAIVRFISDSSVRGLACVRIIHGKGSASDGRPGIFKHKTNVWLRQMPQVRAFCSCKPNDGGTGAAYVLLR